LALVALPATVDARSLYFGINANTRAWGNPGEEQDRVAETGVRRLREDLEWERVEPADGEWKWSATDALFLSAAERGMEILPVLDSSPCWAVPEETDPEDCWRTYPESDSDYADFVAHAVERYGPSGDFWDAHPGLDNDLAPRYWELWNEPYYPYFTNDEVDPARYAALYKAAVTAGRVANPGTDYLVESVVDATVQVKVDPKGWVHWAEGMVEAEPTIGQYIDGIAIHPYPESHDPEYEPENGTDASFKNTDINYERWRELGVNKPIWITEVGYSACSDGGERCVPGENQAEREAQKAEWLTDLFDELGEDDYAFVHAVYLYNFHQWGVAETPNSNKELWFGILDGEDERLLAWNSFATAVEEYDGVPVPNTTISGDTTAGAGASFSFGVNDQTSSLDCQLDSGSWTLCASPKSYSGLAAGSHTFRVRATNAEATESGPATYTWSALTPVFASNLASEGSGKGGVVYPRGMAVDPQGNVWVVDSGNDRVQEFDSKGEFVRQFGSPGTGNGQFDTPVDVALTPGGDLWVTDAYNERVQKFNSKGEYLGQFGSEGTEAGKFIEPSGIAIDSSGNVWVSDHRYYRVEEFDSKGKYIRTISGFQAPEGIAIDPEGHLFVVDARANVVQKFSATGSYISQFGSEGVGNGQFAEPQVIDIDQAGNILVADRNTGRVQEFSQSGEYLTKFGGGELSEPDGVVFAGPGAAYVSDSVGNRVELWHGL
jgi:DNA-binding beta-propeller fold protein YncE